MDKSSQFHMEAAGSLTPELDGAPRACTSTEQKKGAWHSG